MVMDKVMPNMRWLYEGRAIMANALEKVGFKDVVRTNWNNLCSIKFLVYKPYIPERSGKVLRAKVRGWTGAVPDGWYWVNEENDEYGPYLSCDELNDETALSLAKKLFSGKMAAESGLEFAPVLNQINFKVKVLDHCLVFLDWETGIPVWKTSPVQSLDKYPNGFVRAVTKSGHAYLLTTVPA